MSVAADPIALVQESDPSSPVVWVLHDGKAGMRSQALGLAEATGFRVVERPLQIRFPWNLLAPQLWLWPRLAMPTLFGPPWPDLVVGCGRNSALPALLIRRASRGRTLTAQIQDPRIGKEEFDLMVVPEHDRLRGPGILVTRGAVHRVTPEKLAEARERFPALGRMPRPILATLIGGSNKTYRLSEKKLIEIADGLAAQLRENGGSLLLTPSRRTGEKGLRLLRERLHGLPAEIWDGSGENPYFAYLAFADAILVTADSISMVSEAAATGRPVHVIDLPGGNAKFARFHAAMRRAGITRPFAGKIEHWTYSVPDDTLRAGERLRALVLERIAAHEKA